ncbi:MAG TPA: protease modulator HflK [Verrucomicrobiae bacterium]|nr:protease modulator HflK [Verrucomicrobiae bacterium]
MSDEHNHHHEERGNVLERELIRPRAPIAAPEPPTPPPDAGSEALAEALKSSFTIVKWIMGILVLVFLGSGFFKVEPGKKAIILRFGKPLQRNNAELLGPGLHWSFPAPIDSVQQIPYSQFQSVKSTTGWYYTTPEKEATGNEDPPGISLNPARDGYAITGDRDIIHTRATLLYHIEDPIRYEFEFTDGPRAVQDALDNALLYAAARFKVDDVLTRDIARFQDTVRQRVIELVDTNKLGIVVEQCQVQSIPPRKLQDAFDGVLKALSTRDKLHNDALSAANKTLADAAGQAAGITNSAEAERVRLVQSVGSEAKRFNDLLPQYNADPSLFVNVLLAQKIGQVLTNVEDKIYLPERADGKSRELRLQLSREPLAPPQPANP